MRQRRTTGERRAPAVWNILVMVFTVAPLVVVIGASFNDGQFTSFPPHGFSLHWYHAVLTDSAFVQSFLLSVRIAVEVAVLAMLVGLCAAVAITRLPRWFGSVLQFLAIGPLVLPEVLLGLGLLNLLVGKLHIRLNEQTLVLAHLLVTLPFVVNVVSSALSQQDRNLEAAARTLGARPVLAFLTVTLRAIAGAVVAGGLFAFVFSFDNIAISLFLSVPGLVPLPVRMYQYVTYSYDPTVAAASSVLIVISLIVFFLARRLANVEEIFGGGRRRA